MAKSHILHFIIIELLLVYYLLLALFYLLSWLPLPVLHAIGSGIGFLVFRVIGYRRAVVLNNIRLSFPDKSEQECRQIARRFYTHFTDTFMETIKMLTISPAGLKRMCRMDVSLYEKLYAEGRSCQLMTGHFMNWELYNFILPLSQPYPCLAVYMKLSSPVMERLFLKIRSRVGSILIPASQVKQGLEAWKGKPSLLMLGADQSVGNPANAWWMNFLGRPATFPSGPGRNAVKENLPVLYTWLEKVQRGRYVLHTRMLCEKTAEVGAEALTRMFAAALEETIHAHPDNYLWSHKRWKHHWQPAYASNWMGDTPAPGIPETKGNS